MCGAANPQHNGAHPYRHVAAPAHGACIRPRNIARYCSLHSLSGRWWSSLGRHRIASSSGCRQALAKRSPSTRQAVARCGGQDAGTSFSGASDWAPACRGPAMRNLGGKPLPLSLCAPAPAQLLAAWGKAGSSAPQPSALSPRPSATAAAICRRTIAIPRPALPPLCNPSPPFRCFASLRCWLDGRFYSAV